MSHLRRPLLFLFAAGLITACAADAVPDNSDAGDAVGRDPVDDASDTGDGSGADAEPDIADDAPAEVDDDADAADVEDTQSDVVPDTFDCDDVGEECTPRAVYCLDNNTRAFCSRCGFLVSEEDCASGQVCDDTTGVAACRPCVGEECPELVECEPRELTCANFQTVQVCGADGSVESTQPCPAGRRCFDGECGPAGQSTGAACIADVDPATGCIGQLCLCGPGWQAENGAVGCGAPLAGGYCSTSDCAANGCNLGSEICLDVPGRPFGGESFCVLQNSCTQRGRACGSGYECEELPARTAPGSTRTWELGCWLNTLQPIGGTCVTDADCLGGDCRTRNIDGATVNYCASPCGAEGSCPGYAACVEDPDAASGFACLAIGDGESCPRISTEPRWIQDRTVPRYGGGQARVCYFPRSSD